MLCCFPFSWTHTGLKHCCSLYVNLTSPWTRVSCLKIHRNQQKLFYAKCLTLILLIKTWDRSLKSSSHVCNEQPVWQRLICTGGECSRTSRPHNEELWHTSIKKENHHITPLSQCHYHSLPLQYFILCGQWQDAVVNEWAYKLHTHTHTHTHR